MPLTAGPARALRDMKNDVMNAAMDVSREAARASHLEPSLAEIAGHHTTKITNLEATFNLGIIFPLYGAFFASVTAVVVYSTSPIYVLPTDTSDRWLWYTISPKNTNRTSLITEIAEPFAAATNLNYMLSGAGFFLLQFFSGAPLPEATYGLAIFLLLLGGCSGAFHMDASRLGTWQHHADRFGMYCLFSYLACVTTNGLFHAIRGTPATPRSVCSLVTNCAAMFCAVWFLIDQESVKSMEFLVVCGAVIFTGNALTTAFLFARAQAAADGIRGVHAAVQAAKRQQQQAWEARASAAVTETPVLKAKPKAGRGGGGGRRADGAARKGRAINDGRYSSEGEDDDEHDDDLEGGRNSPSNSPRERRSAVHAHQGWRHSGSSVRRLCSAFCLVAIPIVLLQLTCLGTGFAQNALASAALREAWSYSNASNPADVEAGLSARMRHDVLHGSWHILSGIAINTAGHSLVMGLSGRLDQPEMINHWGELAAGATGWLLAILNLGFSWYETGAWAILLTYLGITSVCAPLLTVALCKQVSLHNELVVSAVPLSKRSYSLPGLRLPRWSTRDWNPMAFYHSVVWSPAKELAAAELWAPAAQGGHGTHETPAATAAASGGVHAVANPVAATLTPAPKEAATEVAAVVAQQQQWLDCELGKESDSDSKPGRQQQQKKKGASDLPEGWITHIDESCGVAYYYNTETGETTWTTPSKKAQATAKPQDVVVKVETLTSPGATATPGGGDLGLGTPKNISPGAVKEGAA